MEKKWGEFRDKGGEGATFFEVDGSDQFTLQKSGSFLPVTSEFHRLFLSFDTSSRPLPQYSRFLIGVYTRFPVIMTITINSPSAPAASGGGSAEKSDKKRRTPEVTGEKEAH